jgi:hypothetical protein
LSELFLVTSVKTPLNVAKARRVLGAPEIVHRIAKRDAVTMAAGT